jgi:Transposase DDE domain.
LVDPQLLARQQQIAEPPALRHQRSQALFARFDAERKRQGYLALGGQIIDATIKGGCTPAWPQAKARQKDSDARWLIKRGRVKRKPGPGLTKPGGTPPETAERTAEALLIPVFGYKNHIDIDRRLGFIRRFVVTDAAAHDGHRLPALLDADAFDSRVWADTAYRSAANERATDAGGASQQQLGALDGTPARGSSATRFVSTESRMA